MILTKATADFFGIPSEGKHDIVKPLIHNEEDGTRALILSDIHMPKHNIDALMEAVETAQEADVDVIVLNGDFLDFSRVSSYGKSPDMMRFKDEIEMGRMFLSMLREQFPDAKIYATGGNHQDERIGRYLEQNAPELMDLAELKLENLLRYEEYEIEDYSGSLLAFGDAIIGHGDETRGISGIQPARKALMKFPEANCVIMGHLHRGESYAQRTLSGIMRHGHVSGHLGEMSPSYMGQTANQWRVGFIIAEIKENGRVGVDHWVKEDSDDLGDGKWINVSPVQTDITYTK